MKVMYDENGIIVCISKDVTAIFPPGFSVAEVAICEMPDDACNDTNWVYSDGKVVKRVYTAEEKRQKIEDEKSLRIDRVNQVTQSLHTKLMLGMCIIEEKDSLKKWMHYVNQINGIDSNMESREIRWPESPEKITR
ncbi:tail fiber assembly protein [Serratia sp. IR-2025]